MIKQNTGKEADVPWFWNEARLTYHGSGMRLG